MITRIYGVMMLSAALLCSCGMFGVSPGVTQPCPGQWCLQLLDVNVPVVGKGKLSVCYDTEAAMLQAKTQYEAEGKKVVISSSVKKS